MSNVFDPSEMLDPESSHYMFNKQDYQRIVIKAKEKARTHGRAQSICEDIGCLYIVDAEECYGDEIGKVDRNGNVSGFILEWIK